MLADFFFTVAARLRNAVLILSGAVMLSGCAGYDVKNLAKSDIDRVADEVITQSRALVRELMVKLYRRNPDQLRKVPGMTVEDRLAQLTLHARELKFGELDRRQGISAMNLAFDPDYSGDRVFALIAGLGGMLREAHGYKPELFVYDRFNSEAFLTSAHNVEVLLWKLKHDRQPDGSHSLISHRSNGAIDNLSFERLFGKLIGLQELMSKIAGDSNDRMITGVLHTFSTVFIPLPI